MSGLSVSLSSMSLRLSKMWFKIRIKLACPHSDKCLEIKLFCNNGLRASKELVIFLVIIVRQQRNVSNTS